MNGAAEQPGGAGAGQTTDGVIQQPSDGDIDLTSAEAIVAILGLTGVLTIPVKFFWDELATRSKDKQAVAAAVREKVHTYLEKHYVPTARALQNLHHESELIAHYESPFKMIVLDRWIYTAALYWHARRTMRDEGGGFFFSTRAAENVIAWAIHEVEDLLDTICELNGDERSVLTSGLADMTKPSFLTYQARLNGPLHRPGLDRWRALRAIRTHIVLRCLSTDYCRNFDRIAEAAGHTQTLIFYHASENYAPWYNDMALMEQVEDVDAATKWAERKHEERRKALASSHKA